MVYVKGLDVFTNMGAMPVLHLSISLTPNFIMEQPSSPTAKIIKTRSGTLTWQKRNKRNRTHFHKFHCFNGKAPQRTSM